MAKVELSPEQLQQKKGQMEQLNHDLQGAIDKLKGAANELQGTWWGGAGGAAQTALAQLNAEGKALQESLEAITSAMGGSHQIYVQQEEEAKKAVSNVTNVLGGNA